MRQRSARSGFRPRSAGRAPTSCARCALESNATVTRPSADHREDERARYPGGMRPRRGPPLRSQRARDLLREPTAQHGSGPADCRRRRESPYRRSLSSLRESLAGREISSVQKRPGEAHEGLLLRARGPRELIPHELALRDATLPAVAAIQASRSSSMRTVNVRPMGQNCNTSGHGRVQVILGKAPKQTIERHPFFFFFFFFFFFNFLAFYRRSGGRRGWHQQRVGSGSGGAAGTGTAARGGATISDAAVEPCRAKRPMGRPAPNGIRAPFRRRGALVERQTVRALGANGAPNGYLEYLPPGYDANTPRPCSSSGTASARTATARPISTKVTAWGPPKLIANNKWDARGPSSCCRRIFIHEREHRARRRLPVQRDDRRVLHVGAWAYKVDAKRVYLTGLSLRRDRLVGLPRDSQGAVVAAAVLLSGNPGDPTQAGSAWKRAGCALGGSRSGRSTATPTRPFRSRPITTPCRT